MTEHRRERRTDAASAPDGRAPDSSVSTGVAKGEDGAGRYPLPAGRRLQPEGEIGGPKGPEPTRYGDWEKNGRCSDF